MPASLVLPDACFFVRVPTEEELAPSGLSAGRGNAQTAVYLRRLHFNGSRNELFAGTPDLPVMRIDIRDDLRLGGRFRVSQKNAP